MADEIAVALLTGGSDPPYVFGLATSLISEGVGLDIIGNDELDFREFHGKPGVNFLNLRGDQRHDASFTTKVKRILIFYARLIRYAASAKPRIFHILWNNKFDFFDRTLLMLYYKLLGKKLVLTAHNVNTAKRDRTDSAWNRLTLGTQYRLADHIFVHTEKMKVELLQEFHVSEHKVTVIPFGINNSIPILGLTQNEARDRLGIPRGEKTILSFGRIKPYKGLEYLLEAFQQIQAQSGKYRLIIAGVTDGFEGYWNGIREKFRGELEGGRVLFRTDYVPDAEAEAYFKAADVTVLPYRQIYQSGVLFLAYSFGLPVLAADVGSLKDDILEGKTGFVFRPEDPADISRTIERFFASDLYKDLENRRQEIKKFAAERHSWEVVSRATLGVYAGLLRKSCGKRTSASEAPGASLDLKSPS